MYSIENNNNKLKHILQTCLLFLQTKTLVNNIDNSDMKYTNEHLEFKL